MEFQKSKLDTIEIFNQIIDLLESLNEFIQNIDPGNAIWKNYLKNNTIIDFSKIADELKMNLKMIERNKMKCVIFGKTSNGKSAVINALLGHSLLPSSNGRTTTRFISVVSCEEDVGFIMVGDERKNIATINRLAETLPADKTDMNKVLKIFLPRNYCHILRNDVEIVDSPGLDYSDDDDLWIKKICEDADVFVLVADGCSTLKKTEKEFFIELIKYITRPNVFVLINKWDLLETDEDVNIEKIRAQHFDEVSSFLINSKLYSEYEVHDRIFFISALNVLQRRDKTFPLNEFKEFEKALEKDLNFNGIDTKLRKHRHKALEVVELVFDFLSIFPNFVIEMKNIETKESKIELLVNIRNIIQTTFGDICQQSKKKISKESLKLSSCILKDIEKKENFIERLMKVLLDNLSINIGKIFTENINSLPDKIQNMLLKNHHITLTKEQIEIYFVQYLKLSEPINRYCNNVQSNFFDINEQMKDIFQAQKTKSDMVSGFKRFLKICSPIFMTTSKAISKIHPNVGTAIHVAGAVGIVVDSSCNENKITEVNINKELKRFLEDVVDAYLTDIRRVVDDIINNTLEKCIEGQHNIRNSEKRFSELRMSFGNIRTKLEMEI